VTVGERESVRGADIVPEKILQSMKKCRETWHYNLRKITASHHQHTTKSDTYSSSAERKCRRSVRRRMSKNRKSKHADARMEKTPPGGERVPTAAPLRHLHSPWSRILEQRRAGVIHVRTLSGRSWCGHLRCDMKSLGEGTILMLSNRSPNSFSSSPGACWSEAPRRPHAGLGGRRFSKSP